VFCRAIFFLAILITFLALFSPKNRIELLFLLLETKLNQKANLYFKKQKQKKQKQVIY